MATSPQDRPGRLELERIDLACQDAVRSGPAPIIEEEGLRSQSLARLLEISRALNRIHDRDLLLRFVGDRLRELFDAENGFVVLFDAQGKPQIHSRYGEDIGGEIQISQTILAKVRESREPIVINDAGQHPDLRDRRSIETTRISSVLCAPLIIEGSVIGALQFDHRGGDHQFPVGDLRLLSLFADQVATAFFNLQLIERLNIALEDTRQAQAKLVQAERLSALGQMAGGIAHDFNNTLFIALGSSEVLLSKGHLDPTSRAQVERIRTCSMDAANTVRRLQVFARGTMPEESISSVDPNHVLAEIPDLTKLKWQDEARRRGVEIAVELELSPAGRVRAVPADLREVLVNLVFNAADAIEAGGTITISSGLRGGEAFLRVADDGAGMDATALRKAFEPFFTTKGKRGSGFGLSTSWGIAQRLGGRIDVDSQVGQGSTFTVWLPAVEAGATRVERPQGERLPRARVLVVDDDPEVLETVGFLIEALDHEFRGSTDPQALVETLESEPCDVVIADFGMPGMTGGELAKIIHERRPELPVVLLTGWGAEVEIDEDLQRVVAAVVAKPATLEQLRLALGKALSPGSV